MGWRFRRSIKIAPGIRWNIGSKSSSLSFGPRGAKVTVGTHGTRVTAGIPGTGISFSERLAPGPGDSRMLDRAVPQQSSLPWDETLYRRMGIDRSSDARRQRYAIATAVLLLVGLASCVTEETNFMALGMALVLAAMVTMTIASAIPTSMQLAVRERQRRLEELMNAPYDAADRSTIVAALAKRRTLGLLPSEFPGIEQLLEIHDRKAKEVRLRKEAFDNQAVFEAEVATTGTLPSIEDHERITGRDACHFAAPALYDKRGPNDENGTLYLTNRKAVFMGTTRSEAPWSKVAMVSREELTLNIQRRDRQTPNLYVLTSLSDSLRAEFIARHCLERAGIE